MTVRYVRYTSVIFMSVIRSSWSLACTLLCLSHPNLVHSFCSKEPCDHGFSAQIRMSCEGSEGTRRKFVCFREVRRERLLNCFYWYRQPIPNLLVSPLWYFALRHVSHSSNAPKDAIFTVGAYPNVAILDASLPVQYVIYLCALIVWNSTVDHNYHKLLCAEPTPGGSGHFCDRRRHGHFSLNTQ